MHMCIAAGLTLSLAASLAPAQQPPAAPPAHSPAPAAAAWPTHAEVQSMLQSIVDDDRRVVGIVVGWTDATGTWTAAHGSSGTARPLDAESVFEIGSITKTFTATLLAQMAQRGEVALDDPVRKHLPDDVTLAQSGPMPIRLQDLATHTSGLPRMPANMRPRNPRNPYADYDAQALYAALRTVPLQRPVGAAHEYSNFAYGLLGHALERAARQDLATIYHDRIFAPLQMNSTAVAFTPQMRERLAVGHDESGQPASNWDLGVLAGAGAIRSTLSDMLRYARACAGLDDSPLAAAIAQAQRADLPGPDGNLTLAWGQPVTRSGVTYLWHNGGTGGYRSMMAFDPAHRRAVVVLANSAVDVDDIALHLLLPDFPLQRTSIGPPVDAQMLAQLVGVYEISPGVTRTITTYQGRLFLQRTGQPMRELLPREGRTFFHKQGGFTARFAEGSPAPALIITQRDGTLSESRRLDLPAPTPMHELSREAFDRLAGEYQLGDDPEGLLRVWRDNDRYFAALGSQPPLECFPQSESRVFFIDVDAALVFSLPAQGQATAVTLEQAGISQTAPRKP